MFLSMYYGGTDIIQIVLILGALAITGLASLYIKINYSKFKQVLVKKKYTGFDTAREILDSNGLSDVLILEVILFLFRYLNALFETHFEYLKF